MKCLSANLAFEILLLLVGEAVVLVVPLLMEPLPAHVTLVGTVPSVNTHVGVQCAATVECLPTYLAFVRSLLCSVCCFTIRAKVYLFVITCVYFLFL